jgi:hypothetical protein
LVLQSVQRLPFPVGSAVDEQYLAQGTDTAGRSDRRTCESGNPGHCPAIGFWSDQNNANMVNNNFGFVDISWSVQPCVRPFCAVHMTAGRNGIAQ